MNNQFRQTSAFMLFMGAFLAAATMIHHPTGGSMEYIIHVKKVIVFTHALAIACMPFIGFGAWGLSVHLQTPGRLSMLGFCVFSIGLMGGIIAAAFNGFVMPNFVEHYYGTKASRETLDMIVHYGFYINAAMAYLFIGGTTFAVGVWSVVILTASPLPKWIGYYGLLILAAGLAGLLLKFNFTSVWGFSIFVFGLISWLVLAGVLMWRRKSD
ncbi:hypothetical protein [Emticicia sp. 21SJ11W-3]|uniref:hypothetical protein n=1 Tax=Emticicia sp. 21SJ11W-3 TaxID=2916755 RepID=UPI00209F5DE0|nr:hypothetical protein [Emticicia sp. 21SJ11W-3]UTA66769.1 hypothetical protein MB380_14280 [Emticicia sp. 21SJ11W-3]